MKQPASILANSTAVHTHPELGTTKGMVAMPTVLSNRRASASGTIHGIVPGHGGDVYWVRHDDGTTAPYHFDEFELSEEKLEG